MTMMAEGSVHQLELVPLSEDAWRLCDRNVEEDDPASVVAYVEATADGVEVIWLHGRSGWSHFTELGDVLRAAAADLSPGGAFGRGHRPIEIPHFPPMPAATTG
ncbi:hypothetical protein ACH3VR_17990 [Microbacterium sp. B2969]|uniref:Uncharacterized protein n=1 Tax=Microbacterium alkaliflavum TaxID=3248839 RepID=A0ABW7QDI0_9MICO